MKAFLLIAAAAAAAVRAQPACNVRLFNEFIGKGTVSLATTTGTVITEAEAQGASDYAGIACAAATLQLLDSSKKVLQTVDFKPDGITSQFSILALEAASGTLSAVQFSDADMALDESSDTIDIAQYRIINAYSAGSAAGLDVHGVTSECYNCSHPFMFHVAFGGSSGYQGVDLTWPWEWQLAAPAGGWKSTIFTTHGDELGVYTVVIHNLPGTVTDASALLGVSTDAAGRNPYTPIWAGALICLAAGLLYRAAGWIMVQYGKTTDFGEEMVASVASGTKDFSLVRFFGFDKKVAKAVLAKQARKRAAVEAEEEGGSINSSINSSSGMAERLLAPEDGGAGAGAGAAAPALPAKTASASASAAAPVSTKPNSAGRIRSIDTYRGIALCVMIFVNYGGGSYNGFFDHSRWTGLTVADLLFPWFVWLSGVSAAISFDSERRKGGSRRALIRKTLVRAAKLYCIGLFLNGGANLSQWRILGVLQYFAMSYLCIGLLEAFLSPLHYNGDKETDKSSGSTDGSSKSSGLLSVVWMDVGRYWAQWAVMVILGATYMLVQAFGPVPAGCPTGYIGAGGLADQGLYFGKGCTGGSHRWLDIAIFTTDHIYHNVDPTTGNAISAATCANVYDCDVHDPEGVLGWISAAWMAWLGLQAGRIIVAYRNLGPSITTGTPAAFAKRWLTASLCLCLIGGALCGFSKNGGPIPLNKNLWSPSFVFVLAGFAFFLLTAFYFIVDVAKMWSGAPFRSVGMNSIVIYFCSEVFQSYAPFTILQGANAMNHAEALTAQIGGIMCWQAFARYLYIRGIFINV